MAKAEEDFANKSLWEKLSDASESPKPPIPDEADLKNYKNYRTKILDNIDKIDYSNMIYIAGKGNKTDESFFLQQNLDGSKSLIFTPTLPHHVPPTPSAQPPSCGQRWLSLEIL